MLMIAAVAWAPAFPATAQTRTASEPAAQAASAPRRLSSALPLKRDEASDASPEQVLVAVTVVLALALGAGYLVLRRNGGGLAAGMSGRWGSRDAAVVRSRGRLPLSQHASVHVVQWGDEELLLGSTAQQVTLLAKRQLPASAGTVPLGDAP